jgi:hypothetical protein
MSLAVPVTGGAHIYKPTHNHTTRFSRVLISSSPYVEIEYETEIDNVVPVEMPVIVGIRETGRIVSRDQIRFGSRRVAARVFTGTAPYDRYSSWCLS